MAVIELMMGKKEQISYSDTEASYGTAGTLLEAFGVDATFDPSKDSQNWKAIRGSGEADLDIEDRAHGVEQWGGTLSFVPQNWQFLKFALLKQSSDVTDTGAGAPKTHTFTNTETGLVSFTLERAIQATTDSVRTYEGCQVNSLGINWDVGDPQNWLNVTADIVAEDCNESSSTTSLTPYATAPYLAKYCSLTLGGDAVSYLKSGSLTINNNLSDGFYADYTDLRLKGESAIQTRTYNLTAVANYTDDTFFHLADSGTVIGSTNTLVFQRGASDNLTCTFTGAYLNSPPDPTNLDGFNTVNLDIDINSVAFEAVDTLSDYETFVKT